MWVRGSPEELLWWRADGEVLLDRRGIGHLPRDPTVTNTPDLIPSVLGAGTLTITAGPGPRALCLDRPLPEPWVLALVLVSLLPAQQATGSAPGRRRIDD